MAKKRLTLSQFISKSKEVWGDKYSYDRVEYLNFRTPVTLFCNRHKTYFNQTPKSHFYTKHECCPLCYKSVSGSYQNRWRDSKPSPHAEAKHTSLLNLVLK